MKITDIKLHTVKFGDTGARGAAMGESQYWGGGWAAETLIANPMSVHPKYSRIRSLWMGGGQDPYVIEIFTDEGVSGFCANYGGGVFACAIIEQHFKRFLIGQDPYNIQLIWDQMNRATLPYGLGGVTSMAMAGVDTALYDLVAKAQNLPVYKILGGQTKESIPCYVTIHPDYVDHWRDRGFLGDGMEIMVDCYLSWDIEFTTRVAGRVRDFDVKWFEDPLQNGWATESNRILRDRISPTLLATGNLEFHPKAFHDIIHNHATDIIQPIFSVLEGEPLPVNGRITLDPDKPGFGVELKREMLAP